MNIQVYASGLLTLGENVLRCALGHGGVRTDKTEGDGATPAGQFLCREVLYRPDREQLPITSLPVSAISSDLGWCDDPIDPAYNRRIVLPHSARHEQLYRSDHIYDIVVPLGYNDNPAIPNRGSAIFLHIARMDYSPTAGCVAVALPDLLMILAAIEPSDHLIINPPLR